MISRCAAGALFLVGLFCSCAPDAKYPPTAVKVWCTNVVNDCEEQAREACPAGFHTLGKETWTTRPLSTRGGRSIRHDKIVIECGRAG